MCGIAGILSLDRGGAGDARDTRAAIGRMVGELLHRGPDGHDARIIREADGPTVALGHTRLAIIDLSPAGSQPMVDPPTGNWITYNGEIYNHRQLRAELDRRFSAQFGAGPAWRSHSDTEVILKAYAYWGRDCVRHLRGMFAFAIWDEARDELFIARDPLGIKPCYVYQDAGCVLFASEVRALLASGWVARRLDPVALWEYLGSQAVPAPRTMVAGVRALLPGSWLTVDTAGRTTEAQYWDLLRNAAPGLDQVGWAEACGRLHERLAEATSLHLESDVPVGLFLSGGIDSSAIAALLHEQGRHLHTFSISFAEEGFDESQFARLVADRFGADHTAVHLPESVMLAEVPCALAAMDQPTGDGVNTFIVARAVHDTGLKVALSGLGGDELFAGDPSFSRLARWHRLAPLRRVTPGALRRAAAGGIRSLGRSSVGSGKLAAMLESEGGLAEVYGVMREVLTAGQRRQLLTPSWLEAGGPDCETYPALLDAALQELGEHRPITFVSYGEARTYMHDVLLRDTDQMSMAQGLEVRVPLLDQPTVEYVMGLPDSIKRPTATPKRLLVNALDGMLPREVTHRPKQGFTLPMDLWMRGALRDFCAERLAPERVAARGIFDAARVERLWADFLDGKRGLTWSRVWVLVALDEWLEANRLST